MSLTFNHYCYECLFKSSFPARKVHYCDYYVKVFLELLFNFIRYFYNKLVFCFFMDQTRCGVTDNVCVYAVNYYLFYLHVHLYQVRDSLVVRFLII